MSTPNVPHATSKEKQQPRRFKEVRLVAVHGEKRWQARVQYQGLRASRLCDTQ